MRRANVKLTLITDADLLALKAMQRDRDELNRLQPYDQDERRLPHNVLRVNSSWLWLGAALAMIALALWTI